MAEAAVVLLITKIASVLGEEALKQGLTLFFKEASQLSLVHDKLKPIQDELQVMRGFLADRWQGNSSSDSAVKAWVNNVRKAAYQAEDIVDEVAYLLGKRQRGGLGAFLDKAVHVRPWLDVTHQLQSIEETLSNLSLAKDRYGIDITHRSESSVDAGEMSRRVADASRLLQEDDVVGIQQNKHTLIQWLVDEGEQHQRLCSVWGMGGIGKTTLVSQVYECPEVVKEFDRRAWVSVSQTYQADDLLRSIFKQLCTVNNEVVEEVDLVKLSTMTFVELAKELRRILQGKRYLVVLDDVWDADAWDGIRTDGIRTALIDNKCHSRVVFTSRNFHVARLSTQEYSMKVKLLEEADAWALFCKKAFRDPSRSFPPELESCARKILVKCEGLPLAIVIVGSHLSLRDESMTEWERFYQGLSWELSDNPQLEKVKRILLLSLKELPYYLRNCLLYCSVFPEDAPIKRKRLIWLWLAEGFVERRGQKTMEEVAEDNLNELVHRCMLQVVERNDSGKVKRCRMHDMVRDLLLSISQAEKFCMIYDNRGSAASEESGQGGVRRLSVHNEPREDDIGSWQSRHIRSLLVLYGRRSSAEITKSLMSSGWRLLRVLDLQGIPMESMPGEVFNLFGLRYLSCRKSKLRHISNDIRRLVNLEVLDLAYTHITELPRGITKLKKLRHLIVFNRSFNHDKLAYQLGFVRFPSGIWNLKGLQTLTHVFADDELVRHLDSFSLLTSFKILNVKHHHCSYLCRALTKMIKLSKLVVATAEDEEVLELQGLSDPPPLLQELQISGRLEGGVLPSWFSSLHHLTCLTLRRCQLREDHDPLASLHSLPHLVTLSLLEEAYVGRRLWFRAGWFRKLGILNIVELSQTKMVEVEDGALPSLRRLNFFTCPEMEEIPRGIQHLTALRQFYLFSMPEDFIRSLQGEPDAVQHIAHIQQFFRGDDGKWYLRDPRRDNGETTMVEVPA